MELNFGENIKRLRRNRDMTQEALADALGISAQSVSKWECAYGYPDITQLPAIANYFAVTIDELLGNDEYGKEQDHKYFEEHFRNFEEASEEKIAFVLDYCRRYPDSLNYAYILCANISCNITQVCPENRDKYYPLLLQTAKKLIGNVHYRDLTVGIMIKACPEEEVDEWLDYASYSQKNSRRNRLIDRYETLGKTEMIKQHIYIGNLETIAIQLNRRYPDSVGCEAKAEYHKTILDTISNFSSNGQIPDGWLSYYAYKQLVYAACLYGMGDMDEGKNELLSAVEKLQKYYGLTEEYLDMGSPLFGGIRVNKGWIYAIDQRGEKYKLFGTALLKVFGEPKHTLELLTNPRWTWFDSVRNEDYYKDVVEWLRNCGK